LPTGQRRSRCWYESTPCTFWQSCLIVVAVAHGAVWIALLFVALSGGTNCIQAPAVGAAIPGLVDEANLVAANALNATVDNLTIIAGPMLGAFLLLVSGSVVAVFVANAASFAGGPAGGAAAAHLDNPRRRGRLLRADGADGRDPQPPACSARTGRAWRVNVGG
jgi:hypothetical protein